VPAPADFAARYGPWALVAGGSEGIGAAWAHALAARGLHVLLLARRAEPAERLAQALRRDHAADVRTVRLDLAGEDLGERVAALARELEIGLLVYNAGAAPSVGAFLDAPLERALYLVRLNCAGPVTLCHRLGLAMAERGRGGIVLMSSLAALAGGGLLATYAASKAFDYVFAEGLWQELAPRGVHVLGVLAGLTRTPALFAAGADPTRAPLAPAEPEEVVREALEQLGQGPICIPGAANRAIAPWTCEERAKLVAGMSGMTAALFGVPAPGHRNAP
jgi:short-subunit dehydrogenase